MPVDRAAVVEGLRDHDEEIREYGESDSNTLEAYRTVLAETLETLEADELTAEIPEDDYPGALPTAEWNNYDDPLVSFEQSAEWDNHEAVNEFAHDALSGVTTVGVDGSELGPTREFTVPLGLVQTAWVANHHQMGGAYDRDTRTRVLGPTEVTQPADDSGDRRYPDGRAPGHERYREEARSVVGCIERYADADPLTVVCYDGPLVPTFANTLGAEVRDGVYRASMARVLAASQYHEVPVVGYTAGSSRTSLSKLLRRAEPDCLGSESLVPDAQILDDWREQWGDRSLAFVHRQDGTVDGLETVYEGREYEFGHEVLFAYLAVGDGPGMDYVEFPAWIARAGLTDTVLDVVRAETGIGRGYPEILQQADTDAVLDAGDEQEFLRLVTEYADDVGLPLELDAKELSKRRRRR
jgi:hypothetical protein